MKTLQTIPFHTIPETFAPDETVSTPIAIPIHRIVGHEIRHYLNILTEGLSQLRSQVSIEDQDAVVILEKASEQIGSLIPLLQVDRTDIQKVPVNLNCLLWMQLHLVEPLLNPRDITLTTDIPSDLIHVMGDNRQLGQAFLNVIKNAIDACSEQDTISITCESFAAHVIVTIQDTGIGMTSEQLSRLWQPLYTTKPDGIGLGTCIARQIICNHGGSIGVESTPGIGTTVTIELPLSNPFPF
ncbi:MAG: HAMP domain-containing sensor histidine kinase [bacterium]